MDEPVSKNAVVGILKESLVNCLKGFERKIFAEGIIVASEDSAVPGS